MVNYEIKSQPAMLLATEDIIVENKNVETAQFNVTDRVLTLPRWSFASDVVYDLQLVMRWVMLYSLQMMSGI